MIEQQFDRFKDAPWFKETETELVMVGGVGGIGSWLTLLLTRAGFSPVIYDFDIVEEHNIGGQLFRPSDIGKKKVQAVSNIITTFCDTETSAFDSMITSTSPTHHFTFSAFDNMKARKDLFSVWKKSIKDCPIIPIFIDGRLMMEQIQIFCVTPDKIKDYEKHLFDDSEVADEPCTLRITSHSAAMIASHMVAFFTNHITNLYMKKNMRKIDFFYEYFIPLALTNTTS